MAKYASLPFIGVNATTEYEARIATMNIATSVARSRGEAFQGLLGTTAFEIFIVQTFQWF